MVLPALLGRVVRPTALRRIERVALGLMLMFLGLSAAAQPALQGLAFSYQGELTLAGAPVQGTRTMTFRLFDVPSGGAASGALTLPQVAVDAGLFTVELDYGPGIFVGQQLWLEVEVEGQLLSPRQRITSAPYALYALNGNPGPIGPPGPPGPKGDPTTLIAGNGIAITGDAATGFNIGMSGNYTGAFAVTGNLQAGGDASVAGAATVDALNVVGQSNLGTSVRMPIYINEWNGGSPPGVVLAYCDVGDVLIGGGCHKNGANIVISKMQSCTRGDTSTKPLITTNAGCADIAPAFAGTSASYQASPAQDNAPGQAFWVCLFSTPNSGGSFAQATCLRSHE
jgi:hypothetical protein